MADYDPSEPDVWDGEYHGLPVAIRRHQEFGHLCGYVGVPKTHPLYGLDYRTPHELLRPLVDKRKGGDDLRMPAMELFFAAFSADRDEKGAPPTPTLALAVHGGITWAKDIDGGNDKYPGPPVKEHWWFGFDCNHCTDIAPFMEAKMQEIAKRTGLPPLPSFLEGREYRDLNYVKAECEHLAEQLVAVANSAVAQRTEAFDEINKVLGITKAA